MEIKDNSLNILYIAIAGFVLMIMIGISTAGNVMKKNDLSSCDVTTVAIITDKSSYDYEWVGYHGGVIQHKTCTTVKYVVAMADGSEKYVYVIYPIDNYNPDKAPNVLDVCYNSQDYSMFFVDVAPIYGKGESVWYKDTMFKVY